MNTIIDLKVAPLIFDKWEEFYNIQKEDSIPNLSLYVVNLHPEVEEKIKYLHYLIMI